MTEIAQQTAEVAPPAPSAWHTTILPWLQQTSTIAGIATMVGTVTAAVMGTMSWSAAVPTLVGAAVAIAMPGHPSDAAVAERAAAAALAAAAKQ